MLQNSQIIILLDELFLSKHTMPSVFQVGTQMPVCMSLPFLFLWTASKIADWAIIPNFKSFQTHFSVVLKFIQHSSHHCKAHHSVALSIFVVSSCCHP